MSENKRCGICLACQKEDKAKSVSEAERKELNEYDRVYGGFLRPGVPSNCPVKDLGKYSCTAQRAADAVGKLNISLGDDFEEYLFPARKNKKIKQEDQQIT
jgi:hypothetical protein